MLAKPQPRLKFSTQTARTLHVCNVACCGNGTSPLHRPRPKPNSATTSTRGRNSGIANREFAHHRLYLDAARSLNARRLVWVYAEIQLTPEHNRAVVATPDSRGVRATAVRVHRTLRSVVAPHQRQRTQQYRRHRQQDSRRRTLQHHRERHQQSPPMAHAILQYVVLNGAA